MGGLKADDLAAFDGSAFKNVTQFKAIKLAPTQKSAVVKKV